MSDKVHYEFSESVSTITMDDGKANVVSTDMSKSLNVALDRAEADDGIVVLTGRERVFSGGFDLNVFKEGDSRSLGEMMKAGGELAERLLRFPRPVVAACNGHAYAMGVFLLLVADYRIGCRGFRYCANEVAIGLTVPYFALEIMRRRLPPAILHRAATCAEVFSGEAALAAGFVDELVESDRVLPAAQAKARDFSKLDLNSYYATKLRLADQHQMRSFVDTDTREWSLG